MFFKKKLSYNSQQSSQQQLFGELDEWSDLGQENIQDQSKPDMREIEFFNRTQFPFFREIMQRYNIRDKDSYIKDPDYFESSNYNIINKQYISIGQNDGQKGLSNAPNNAMKQYFYCEDSLYVQDQIIIRLQYFLNKLESIENINDIVIDQDEQNIKEYNQDLQKLLQKIFNFPNMKYIFYQNKNIKEFKEYLIERLNAQRQQRKIILEQYKKNVGQSLKDSRNQKLFNDIFYDEQNFSIQSLEILYRFFMYNKFNELGYAFVYKINFPFNIDLWNKDNLTRQFYLFQNINQHPFYVQESQTSLEQKINPNQQVIQRLNSETDKYFQERLDNKQKQVQNINIDFLLDKRQKHLNLNPLQGKFPNQKFLNQNKIKLSQKLGKQFQYKNSQINSQDCQEFVQLDFCNNYIMELTLKILFEASDFILSQSIRKEFRYIMSEIFQKKFNMVNRLDFYEEYGITQTKSNFIFLEYFEKNIQQYAKHFQKYEKKRYVFNLIDLDSNFLDFLEKKIDYIPEVNNEQIFTNFEKFNLIINKQEEFRAIIKSKNGFYSNKIIDKFLLLINQLYQRIQLFWNFVEKVFKEHQEIQTVFNKPISEFTNVFLISSLSHYLFPNYSKETNNLQLCFPRNYFLLYNLDVLIETILDYFEQEVLEQNTLELLHEDQGKYFKSLQNNLKDIDEEQKKQIQKQYLEFSFIYKDEGILKLNFFKCFSYNQFL